jgi:hypothetical protein
MKTQPPKIVKSRPNRANKRLFNRTEKSLDLFSKQSKLGSVSGNNQNDRLEILKANCEQEIRETEEKLRRLRAELSSLVLFAQKSEKLANPKSEPDRYASMGLTDTILDVVERLKGVSVVGSNTSQIRDYMIAHGFPLSENPHNFGISVATTLQRLTEQGRVKRAKISSGNFYKPK